MSDSKNSGVVLGASGLPVRPIEVNSETQQFWDATAEGKLLLSQCDTCSKFIWYPRSFCPHCGSEGTTLVEASGKGTIYSFSITRKGQGAWAGVAPYVIAYVELTEGVRVLSNIVGCDPNELRIGTPVQVTFDDTGAGMSLYRFTPQI